MLFCRGFDEGCKVTQIKPLDKIIIYKIFKSVKSPTICEAMVTGMILCFWVVEVYYVAGVNHNIREYPIL